MPFDFVQVRIPRDPAHMAGGIAPPAPFLPNLTTNRFYTNKSFQFAPPPPFSLDLVEAAKRQILFARKITSIYPTDPVPIALLEDSQQRYAKFMNLIRISAVYAPVPALDIDLFWHTHQLSSSNYIPWCRHHIGRIVNHDDTVETGNIASGLDQTKEAWEQAYNEDYLNPSRGLTFQNANSGQHQTSTADKVPPPNLTPAQRELWDFDVKHQILHEQENYEFVKLNQQLAKANQWMAAVPQLPIQQQSEGFMMRLLKAAVADPRPTPYEMALHRRNHIIANIHNAQYNHRKTQESLGRTRWPLLVAARGWGNPNVTFGAYNWPSQGTQTVDFPMYVATWYDLKPLGFYDYTYGGDGVGVIKGGGARLGGGMCAGKFDGGNCVAPPPPPPKPSGDYYDTSGGCS
jgi:Glycine-rich domain-containing protein-like